jgi:hypothetical protein
MRRLELSTVHCPLATGHWLMAMAIIQSAAASQTAQSQWIDYVIPPFTSACGAPTQSKLKVSDN